MITRLRRFRMEYDPQATCCCSAEEHLNGEYVLLEDYERLEAELDRYKELVDRIDRNLAKALNGEAVHV